MKNIQELRSELCVLFDQIQNNEVTLPRAKELTNTAGKIINSLKVELVYAALRKEVPVIEFLGGNLSPEERNQLLTEPIKLAKLKTPRPTHPTGAKSNEALSIHG